MRPSQFLRGCMLITMVACTDAFGTRLPPNINTGGGGGGGDQATVELYGVVSLTSEVPPRLGLQTTESLVILVGLTGLQNKLGKPMFVTGHWTYERYFAVESFRPPTDPDDETFRVKGGG